MNPDKIMVSIGASLAVLVLTCLASVSSQYAFALESLTVSTDRNSYSYGESYTISGAVSPVVPHQLVSIQIDAPENPNLATVSVVPSPDGKYSYQMQLGNKNIPAGTFTINASYGNTGNQTKFSYHGTECIIGYFWASIPGGPIERMPANNLRILDSYGNAINGTVKVGQQIQITTNVANGQRCYEPFTYLVQIQDIKGVTVSLSWINGTLNSGQSLSPEQSWIPYKAGTYSAQVFFWQSLTNPNALMPPTSVSFDVVPRSD